MSEAMALPWLNNPVAVSAVLRPRLRVLLRGFEGAPTRRQWDGRQDRNAYDTPQATVTELQGAWQAQVERNNWYHGDRFSIEAPLYGGPAFGLAWWSAQAFGLMAEIQMQTSEGAWQTITLGHVDKVDAQPVPGIVRIEGRDLTARFIETKTQEAFPNRTASQVVEELAGRHGIRVQATRTTALVRSYYVRDHVHFTLDQFSRSTTEWDLMVSLAQYEGFDLFVEGDTLYFRPPVEETAKPFVVQWRNPMIDRDATYGRESNVLDIRLSRALTLARDIEVQVKSWNSQRGAGFVKTARAIGGRSASPGRAATQYGTPTQRTIFVVPNLSEVAAQKYANNQLLLLSQNERLMSFRMPADLRVTPRTLLQLQGTGSDWDQFYHVDNITLSMDFEGGFGMSVAAKNRDARSQVVLR